MSYILDALKKSDRERQRGKIPGLNSIHDPYDVSPDNRFSGQQIKYIFVAIGCILLISIPAITWYWVKIFANTDTPAVIADTPVVIENTPVAIEKTRETVPEPEINKPSTSSAKSPTEYNSTYLPAPPPPKITAYSRKIMVLPEQADPPAEKEITVSFPSQESLDIPGIKDLSPSIREAIPDLRFAGHTYSDSPEKRMIIINSNILREGDRVDNTLKLVEITWTGVILDHNGKRFSVDIE